MKNAKSFSTSRYLVNDMNIKTRLPYDSPHLKVMLLLKCYLSDKKLPNQEYVLDLKSVFDQILRILQAMISLTAWKSWLYCTLKLIYLGQMLVQGLMVNCNSTNMLPYMSKEISEKIKNRMFDEKLLEHNGNLTVPLMSLGRRKNEKKFNEILNSVFHKTENKAAEEIIRILKQLPILEIGVCVKEFESNFEKKVAYNEDSHIYFECENGEKLLIELKIRRQGGNNYSKVYSKKFSKQKEESWFFILAYRDELVKMERFTVKRLKHLDVRIDVPHTTG